MSTEIRLPAPSSSDLLTGSPASLVIGRADALRSADDIREGLGVSADTWSALLERTKSGDAGASATTWVGDRKVIIGVLPEPCSRHNSPSRAWAIPGLVKTVASEKDALVVHVLSDAEHAVAAGLATARGLPLFDGTSKDAEQRVVSLLLMDGGSVVVPAGLREAMDGVRLAARLFDTPTNVLHTDGFVEEAQAVAVQTGCSLEVIRGEDLREQGFGGLYGVACGKVFFGESTRSNRKTLQRLDFLNRSSLCAPRCPPWHRHRTVRGYGIPMKIQDIGVQHLKVHCISRWETAGCPSQKSTPQMHPRELCGWR